jgi:TatA/E family protein of Tat protein translocase
MNLMEMLLLFMLGFVLFGPKKTSEIANQVGQAMAKFKRTANDMQEELMKEAANLNLSPEAILNPAIEAQRQTIVGVLPAWVTAMASEGDAASVVSEVNSAAEHVKAGLSKVSEQICF